MAPVPSRVETIALDTGVVVNTGRDQETIALLHVCHQGAPWMRLSFSEIQLAGSVAAGTGSFLRLTSVRDGHEQILDAKTAAEWNHTSAYFNGDLIRIELVAYPGTGDNRVRLDELVVGAPPHGGGTETLCGADDRQLSNDPRAARLLPLPCSGFLIDDDCGCFLTAGHCKFGVNVAQFNVPLSDPDGTINHPPPSDQYSIDSDSLQYLDEFGPGNDWTYFGAFANSTTGKTAAQAQGSTYVFTAPPAWSPALQVRITGYGYDDGTSHRAQQTDVGPWAQDPLGGIVLDYQVDTQTANSGSPVIQEESGVVMGVHTNGGCTVGGGTNFGTSAVQPDLQMALANPLGVCKKVVTTYCTAKASSAGCLASISTSDPSSQPTSGASGYSVVATQVQGLKNGLVFAGIAGPTSVPFNGGILCVQPPTKRGPVTPSGGVDPNGCDGGYATLVNDGNVIPSGLDAGSGNSAWYQYWYRDPQNGAGNVGTALSDALQLDFQ